MGGPLRRAAASQTQEGEVSSQCARLCAVLDPENQCIYIEESAPCGCVPGQAAHTEGMLLDAGICLRELNRHLRKGDIVYGGK